MFPYASTEHENSRCPPLVGESLTLFPYASRLKRNRLRWSWKGRDLAGRGSKGAPTDDKAGAWIKQRKDQLESAAALQLRRCLVADNDLSAGAPSTRPTLRLAWRRPETVTFNSDVIRRSRSTDGYPPHRDWISLRFGCYTNTIDFGLDAVGSREQLLVCCRQSLLDSRNTKRMNTKHESRFISVLHQRAEIQRITYSLRNSR